MIKQSKNEVHNKTWTGLVAQNVTPKPWIGTLMQDDHLNNNWSRSVVQNGGRDQTYAMNDEIEFNEQLVGPLNNSTLNKTWTGTTNLKEHDEASTEKIDTNRQEMKTETVIIESSEENIIPGKFQIRSKQKKGIRSKPWPGGLFTTTKELPTYLSKKHRIHNKQVWNKSLSKSMSCLATCVGDVSAVKEYENPASQSSPHVASYPSLEPVKSMSTLNLSLHSNLDLTCIPDMNLQQNSHLQQKSGQSFSNLSLYMSSFQTPDCSPRSTRSDQCLYRTHVSDQRLHHTHSSDQSLHYTHSSDQSLNHTHSSDQSVLRAYSSNKSLHHSHTPNQSLRRTHTPDFLPESTKSSPHQSLHRTHTPDFLPESTKSSPHQSLHRAHTPECSPESTKSSPHQSLHHAHTPECSPESTKSGPHQIVYCAHHNKEHFTKQDKKQVRDHSCFTAM